MKCVSLSIVSSLSLLASLALYSACERKDTDTNMGGSQRSKKSLGGDAPVPSSGNDSQDGIFSNLIMLIESRDFGSAIALINKQPSGPDRSKLLDIMAAKGLDSSLKTLEVIFSATKDSNERLRMASAIGAKYAQSNPGLLFDEAQRQTSGDARNRLQFIAVHGALLNGSKIELMSLFEKMPYSRERTELIGEIAVSNFRAEGASSLEWLAKMEIDEDCVAGARALMGEVSASGDIAAIDATIEMFQSRSANADWSLAVTTAAQMRLKALGREKTLEWIHGLSGEQHDLSLDFYVRQSEGVSFQEALELAKGIGDNRIREGAYFGVSCQAASRNPEVFSKTVTAIEPEVRPIAIKGLVYKWFDIDSLALSDWINSLPIGNDRDTALATLSGSLSSSDKRLARQTAGMISEEKHRNRVLEGMR